MRGKKERAHVRKPRGCGDQLWEGWSFLGFLNKAACFLVMYLNILVFPSGSLVLTLVHCVGTEPSLPSTQYPKALLSSTFPFFSAFCKGDLKSYRRLSILSGPGTAFRFPFTRLRQPLEQANKTRKLDFIREMKENKHKEHLCPPK